MKARILQPEEWGKINAPAIPETLIYTEPKEIAVIVVEDDDGKVVASICAMRVTHLEGLWIAPEYRKHPGVFRALKRLTYAVPRVRGERWVFGGAADGDELMASICERLGGKMMPLKFYAMPVGDN